MAGPTAGPTLTYRERGGGVSVINAGDKKDDNGLAGMTHSTKLRQAYQHSRLDRCGMVAGAGCRCFHGLTAFCSEQIRRWIDDGETALFPNCGVDAALPGQADCLSKGSSGELHAAYVDGASKKYTPEECAAGDA